jgi:hypothetical protein
MRRRFVFIVSAVLAVAALGSAALASRAANAPDADKAPSVPKARQFVGYWMGIDPLDGGDSRRGITRNDDRTFSIVGRDTVFTLCDGTDRAIVTVNDAVVAGSALVSDELRITCLRDGSTVLLEVRYEVVDPNIVREVTTQDGEPVDEIIFHRVSER